MPAVTAVEYLLRFALLISHFLLGDIAPKLVVGHHSTLAQCG